MVRIILVRPFADFPPQVHDFLLVLVILHKAVCHIHAESVDTLSVPESDDVLQLLSYCLRARCIHALLPWTGRVRIRITIVEGRLAGIEVLHIELVPRILALHPFTDGVLHIVRVLQHCLQISFSLRIRQAVRPYIIVGILEIRVL